MPQVKLRLLAILITGAFALALLFVLYETAVEWDGPGLRRIGSYGLSDSPARELWLGSAAGSDLVMWGEEVGPRMAYLRPLARQTEDGIERGVELVPQSTQIPMAKVSALDSDGRRIPFAVGLGLGRHEFVRGSQSWWVEVSEAIGIEQHASTPDRLLRNSRIIPVALTENRATCFDGFRFTAMEGKILVDRHVPQARVRGVALCVPVKRDASSIEARLRPGSRRKFADGPDFSWPVRKAFRHISFGAEGEEATVQRFAHPSESLVLEEAGVALLWGGRGLPLRLERDRANDLSGRPVKENTTVLLNRPAPDQPAELLISDEGGGLEPLTLRPAFLRDGEEVVLGSSTYQLHLSGPPGREIVALLRVPSPETRKMAMFPSSRDLTLFQASRSLRAPPCDEEPARIVLDDATQDRSGIAGIRLPVPRHLATSDAGTKRDADRPLTFCFDGEGYRLAGRTGVEWEGTAVVYPIGSEVEHRREARDADGAGDLTLAQGDTLLLAGQIFSALSADPPRSLKVLALSVPVALLAGAAPLMVLIMTRRRRDLASMPDAGFFERIALNAPLVAVTCVLVIMVIGGLYQLRLGSTSSLVGSLNFLNRFALAHFLGLAAAAFLFSFEAFRDERRVVRAAVAASSSFAASLACVLVFDSLLGRLSPIFYPLEHLAAPWWVIAGAASSATFAVVALILAVTTAGVELERTGWAWINLNLRQFHFRPATFWPLTWLFALISASQRTADHVAAWAVRLGTARSGGQWISLMRVSLAAPVLLMLTGLQIIIWTMYATCVLLAPAFAWTAPGDLSRSARVGIFVLGLAWAGFWVYGFVRGLPLLAVKDLAPAGIVLICAWFLLMERRELPNGSGGHGVRAAVGPVVALFALGTVVVLVADLRVATQWAWFSALVVCVAVAVASWPRLLHGAGQLKVYTGFVMALAGLLLVKGDSGALMVWAPVSGAVLIYLLMTSLQIGNWRAGAATSLGYGLASITVIALPMIFLHLLTAYFEDVLALIDALSTGQIRAVYSVADAAGLRAGATIDMVMLALALGLGTLVIVVIEAMKYSISEPSKKVLIVASASTVFFAAVFGLSFFSTQVDETLRSGLAAVADAGSDGLGRLRTRFILAESSFYHEAGDWLTKVRWLADRDFEGRDYWVANANSDVAFYGLRGYYLPGAIMVSIATLILIATLAAGAAAAYRGSVIARTNHEQKERLWASVIAVTALASLAIQVVVHLAGGSLDHLPVTGIAYPWLSHGGSTSLAYTLLVVLAVSELRACVARGVKP